MLIWVCTAVFCCSSVIKFWKVIPGKKKKYDDNNIYNIYICVHYIFIVF